MIKANAINCTNNNLMPKTHYPAAKHVGYGCSNGTKIHQKFSMNFSKHTISKIQ